MQEFSRVRAIICHGAEMKTLEGALVFFVDILNDDIFPMSEDSDANESLLGGRIVISAVRNLTSQK
ncbi:hypothetical protein KIN20_007334 [Parelaphostrongylus tenuis]|uniref:Uncharacterized protein n=1 Tax=Parelaphostrongylus tenuis TaxID=148309 RepID=A0AAD5MP00_PARTN|nr:hypothetical protein KIN20_007334 [Parelaphostrongylus tenuis]